MTKETDKNLSDEKSEKNDERPVTLTEGRLFELIERGSQKTAHECFKHFEKFHKEEMEFQRKVELEDRDFEKQKHVEERDFQRKNIKIERWWKIFAIVLAAAGFYLFWVGGLETEKATSQRAANQHKVDMIREDITEKKKMVQEATVSISNLRLVDEEIIRRCVYGHPYSPEQQDKMRRVARQKIYDAFAVVGYIFDDSIWKQQEELTSFEQKIPDICAYKGDLDEELRLYKINIYNSAHKSILKDQKKIDNLK